MLPDYIKAEVVDVIRRIINKVYVLGRSSKDLLMGIIIGFLEKDDERGCNYYLTYS